MVRNMQGSSPANRPPDSAIGQFECLDGDRQMIRVNNPSGKCHGALIPASPFCADIQIGDTLGFTLVRFGMDQLPTALGAHKIEKF